MSQDVKIYSDGIELVSKTVVRGIEDELRFRTARKPDRGHVGSNNGSTTREAVFPRGSSS